MPENSYNKVQINRTVRKGIDRYGNKVNETTQMFNIRTEDVDEAVTLYNDLLKKFYAKPKKEEKEE